MRFTFLGTGTSAGIPCIACDCHACTSADPRDTRTRASALVEWIDPRGAPRAVLIDAGPDLRQQALRHGMRALDAILFTHHHVDHIFGLDEVRRFNAVMRTPIDIYAERPTLAALHRVYQHIFDSANNIQPAFVATLIAHEIQPGLSVELWGMRFIPIRLLHGRMPILGFRIEPTATLARATSHNAAAPDQPWWPLAYCTDVSAIPPDTWPMLEGLGTLALDALRHRKHPTHFSLGQAVSIAHRVAARQTWLIHMSHEIIHAPTEAHIDDPRIRLAHDRLSLGSLHAPHPLDQPAIPRPAE